jgi:cysteine desulfurase family protein
MIYFDNAATSLPKPKKVKDAVLEALDACGNPSRGAHDAALNGMRILAEARTLIAGFFHAGDAKRSVFTSNATAALNIAISGVRGHIITTAAEHNSVLRPLYRRGNFTIIPVDRTGHWDMDLLEPAVRADTEAVVITHASNLTGTVYDIDSAGAFCKGKGLKFIVDASQTAGLIPIDMQKSCVSALCFSGHKALYGPQGTGGICLSGEYAPAPLIVGGSGFDTFSREHPSKLPDMLEAGTQNVHGIAGLKAGVEYVRDKNGFCFQEALRISKHFIGRVSSLPYQLLGISESDLRVPVVAISHKTIDSAEIAYRLNSEYNIAVRAGAHCAPLMHQALGTGSAGAVRFSFSHFNSLEEVEKSIDALRMIAS